MIKAKWVLALSLVLSGQYAEAADLGSSGLSNLDLTNPEEIQAAQRINEAMEVISARVMACVKEQSGETKGCTCESRSNCPFKEEYDFFIGTFCEVTRSYPMWKEKNVFYQEDAGAIGHTLGTRNINLNYGKECQ